MIFQLAGLRQGFGIKLIGEQVAFQVAAPENVGGVLLLVQGQSAADGGPDAEVGRLSQGDVLALLQQGEGVQAGGAGVLLCLKVISILRAHHIEAALGLAVVQTTEIQIGIDGCHYSVFTSGHIHIHQLVAADEVEALVVGVVAQIFHGGVVIGRAGDLADLHGVLEAGVVHHIKVGHPLIAVQLRGGVEQITVAVSGARKGDHGVINKLTIIVGVAGEALPLTVHK